MQTARRLVPSPKAYGLALATLITLGLAAAHPALAQDTTYTDSATFLSHVQSGSYLETFDSLPSYDSVTTPMNFSGNGFTYTATASGGLFSITPDPTHPADHALSTNSPTTPLVITFTSGNVTAVGGSFFETILNGTETPGNVTITLNDGTTKTLTATGGTPQPFAGFTSSASIHSLTVTVPANFSTINNFVVGAATTAVPEPSSVAAFAFTGLAAAGLMLRARKRSAVA